MTWIKLTGLCQQAVKILLIVRIYFKMGRRNAPKFITGRYLDMLMTLLELFFESASGLCAGQENQQPGRWAANKNPVISLRYE